MLRIYNTLSRSKEDFVPIEPGKVRMYVCGMTVYDYCHVGHGRMLVAFDVVQRWLRASGYALTYVRNITDIDDKIIKRAVDNNESTRQLTGRFIAAMNQDLDALGVQRPDHEPRATGYVPQMLNLIGLLEDNGLAYRSNDGDVNFAVRKFDGYGKLSGKSLDDLRAGERVAVGDGKQDPLDFVLWKSAKPDEPSEVKWPSTYGAGRPGWHIECSAMATSLLGKTLDIHGGGADLQFPHHENEIAQSEGAYFHDTPGQFARYWMHNGFVRIDDQKMSKSLGNFFTIREVLRSFDAEVVRLFFLRAHYRSALNYSDAHLEDARASLLRLYNALPEGPAGTPAAIDWQTRAAIRFREAMDDDFNTPVAVSVLFDLVTDINRSGDAATLAQFRALAGLLGLLEQDAGTVKRTGLKGSDRAGGGLTEEQIDAQIQARAAAKKAKDFAQADRIRADLLGQGVMLEDTAAGTTWRKL